MIMSKQEGSRRGLGRYQGRRCHQGAAMPLPLTDISMVSHPPALCHLPGRTPPRHHT